MARTLITTARPYIRTSLFPIFQSKNRVISTTAILSRNRSLVLSYKTISPLVFNDGGSKVSIFFGFGDGGRRGLSVGATHVNDAGSIDQPLMQSMEKKIKEQLNAELVSVRDTSGDGRHVSIDVISSAFEGQSTVNRQRMVYRAIWEELQNTVHAVDQMTTKTPSEAGAQK